MKKILAIVLAVVMLLPVFAVNSFAADSNEIVVFEDAAGVKAGEGKLSDCVNSWDFFGMGGLWNRNAATILDFTADDLKGMLNEGGYKFSYVFGKNSGNPVLVFNGDFDNGVKFEVSSAGADKFEATIALDDAKAKWESLGKTVDEITSMVIQTWTGDMVLYSAKFTKPAPAPGTEIEVQTPVDLVIGFNKGAAAVTDGAAVGNGDDRFGITIPTVEKDKKIKLRFVGESNDPFRFWIADGWTGCSTPVPADESLGFKDGKFDITYEFTSTGTAKHLIVGSNPSGASFGSFKLTNVYVVTTEIVEGGAFVEQDLFKADGIYDGENPEPFGTTGVSKDGGWFCTFSWKHGSMRDQYAKAIQQEGALIEVITKGPTIKNAYLQSNKDGYAAKSIDTKVSETQNADGNTVTVFDGNALVKAYTEAYNFNSDLCNVGFDTTGATTILGIRVYIKVAAPVNRVPGYRGCIYVNDQYHAYLIAGHFLVRDHEDNGYGQCKACYTEMSIEAQEDVVPQDTIHYDMTAAQGQDTEASLAEGLLLADTQEGIGNCRIATNWVSGGKVWTDVTKAISDNADAFVKIVYTGNIDKLVFQTDKGGYEAEMAVAESYKEDDKSVAMISCADIIAGSPVALSGDFGGWANLILHFDGDATLYAFTVITPAPTTTDETIEVVDPTEPGDTDEEPDDANVEEPNEEPVEEPKDNNPPTGIVLAVLPMIVAAAACVASKRK